MTAPDSTPDSRTTVTAGQAGLAADPAYRAYEAYVMAAPDDVNFPEWEDLDDWEREACGAAAQAAYETRAQQEAAAAPAPAGDWWVCTAALPPHGDGQKIIGPFATQELALNVRTYIEKAERRSDLWVDDVPQAAPDLTVAMAEAASRELAQAMAEARHYRDALAQVAKHHDDAITQVRIIARIAKRALEGK